MIHWIAVVIKIFILIFLFFFSFCITKVFIENHLIEKSIKMVYRQLKKKEAIRIQAEERLRYEDGRQEKEKFLTQISLLLTRSNLKKIFPFLSTELYVFGTLTAGIAIFLLVQSVTGLLLGVMAFLVVMLISFLILYFLAGHNYKKTEKMLLNFANLLENYSKTTDDIIAIFQKVVPYMENPIRDALEECCIKAVSTGKVSASLNELSDKIEHEKFRELIRNLEICSRYEANYAEIITESKCNLREYMAAKEKRKEVKNDCKINIVIMLLASMLIINMLTGLGEKSVWAVLTGSLIGNFIILYCMIVGCIVCFMFLSIDK